MHPILTFLFVLLIPVVAFSQAREVVHTSFPADSVIQLNLHFTDSVAVHIWHNSAVFCETEIVLTGCTANVLNHAIAQGRYSITSGREGQKLAIRQGADTRGGFNTPKGYCEETVVHRLYIPADFKSSGDFQWQRPVEVSKTTINY